IVKGATNYPENRNCFSCHHQAMAVLTLTSAKRHGFNVDDKVVKGQITFSLRTFRNTKVIAQGKGVGGDTTGVVYALNTFAAAGRSRDGTMKALVQYLLVKQSKDGSWPIAFRGDRPPTMGSKFTNVGLALFVLKQYSPPKYADGATELQKRID